MSIELAVSQTLSLEELLWIKKPNHWGKIVLEVGCASRASRSAKASFKVETGQLDILVDPRIDGVEFGKNKPNGGIVFPFAEKVKELPLILQSNVDLALLVAPDPLRDEAVNPPSNSAAEIVEDLLELIKPCGHIIVVYERYSYRQRFVAQSIGKIAGISGKTGEYENPKIIEITSLCHKVKQLSGVECRIASEFPLNNATVLILKKMRGCSSDY